MSILKNVRPFAVLVALSLAAPAVAAPSWSAASWERDLADEAGRVRAERPDAWARLLKLEGLSPRVYLKKRRPEPEVARELGQLVQRDEVPAVLLAALLHDGLADYPVSSAADFPPSEKGKEAALIAQEREQLEDGLVLALGASGHPSAPYVTARRVLDTANALARRSVAANALGKTRTQLATDTLSRIALDGKAPAALRTAAMQGLGHVRSVAAVDALVHAIEAGGDSAYRVAAVTSLGQASSSWALAKEPREVADEMGRRATAALVIVLTGDADAAVQRAADAALGVVAHPSALDALTDAARSAADDGVRARLQRAQTRVQRAVRRAR